GNKKKIGKKTKEREIANNTAQSDRGRQIQRGEKIRQNLSDEFWLRFNIESEVGFFFHNY
ncbi:unnamed protein product, partial [Arabidopsis halleri]